MAAVIQQQMNVSGISRAAAVNSLDRQTGKAAAELWKRLPGLSTAILRARVDVRAYVDVFYGDEEQRSAHVLTLKYVVM